MKFFILTSAFFLVWSILGFVALACYHDRRARAGGSCRVTALQVFLGGPILWIFELFEWLRERRRKF